MLANLALESLPVHADKVLALLALELRREPVPQALEVNEAHTSRAEARHDAGVLLRRLLSPAEPAGGC